MLWLGDCLKLMDDVPDGSIDAIITDPPYAVTKCRWDTTIDLDLMWRQFKRVVKPKGAIVLHAQQPFASLLIVSNPQQYRYEWIWEKEMGTGFLNANRQPMRRHECILVFSSGQTTYHPQKTGGKPYTLTSRPTGLSTTADPNITCGGHTTVNEGDRYPTSVLRFARDRDKLHPTQKPLALAEYLIRTYTNAFDTVLDPFAGSGTVGAACRNTNRNYLGMEQDTEIYEVASKRIGG